MAIVIGGAEMLAARKSNSSGPFPDKLRNPSMRFGGVSSDLFPHAIHKNSGNGQDSSRGRQESQGVGFLLLDATLRPIYANEDALAILSYPGFPSRIKGCDDSLQHKIRSLLPGDRKSTRLNSSH